MNTSVGPNDTRRGDGRRRPCEDGGVLGERDGLAEDDGVLGERDGLAEDDGLIGERDLDDDTEMRRRRRKGRVTTRPSSSFILP